MFAPDLKVHLDPQLRRVLGLLEPKPKPPLIARLLISAIVWPFVLVMIAATSIVAIGFSGFATMKLWNWYMPAFGVPAISFVTACCVDAFATWMFLFASKAGATPQPQKIIVKNEYGDYQERIETYGEGWKRFLMTLFHMSVTKPLLYLGLGWLVLNFAYLIPHYVPFIREHEPTNAVQLER